MYIVYAHNTYIKVWFNTKNIVIFFRDSTESSVKLQRERKKNYAYFFYTKPHAQKHCIHFCKIKKFMTMII